jgi:hypothetical protein
VYDASDDEIDHDLSYNIGANEIAEGHFALFVALLIGIITLGTRGKGKGLAAGLTAKGGNGMSGKLLQWGADHGKQLPILQNMAKNSRTNASMFEDNAQRGYAAIPKKAGDTTGESVGQVKKDATETATTQTKPYSNPAKRPPYAKGQVETVWNKAKLPNGKVYDPNNGQELTWDTSKPRTGQWDMGHITGKEYRTLHQQYMNEDISYDEFMHEYQNPDNYQPESIHGNRSHEFEAK